MRAKATISKQNRIKSSILMWVILALCIIALGMIVYNIVITNYWYVVSYFVGILIGISYILVKYNELYTTYVSCDNDNLYIRCWDNCFFPYQTLYKSHLLGELLPSKCVKLKIPIEDICGIIIGTKSFIKRNTDDPHFLDSLALYENSKSSQNQKLLDKMDLMYIITKEDESIFFNISLYDNSQMIRILKNIKSLKPSVEFRLNGRAYRKFNMES